MQTCDLRSTIIIVDDEPINIRYIGELLSVDYDILTFTSGEDAILFLQSCDSLPDLILLDILMPNLNGFEVCELLKANSKLCKIPVIFITALASEEDEERGFLTGGVDYIKKPFSKTIVKSRIDNQIKLKKYQDILELSSKIDALTGIHNRRYFSEALAREFLALNRYKGSLSCLMIDIDNFKTYNDNYGHLAGDECLRSVAMSIKTSLMRKNDICARFGGEEFVVLLPGTDERGAIVSAESILQNIRNLNILHEYSTVCGFVSISVGCTTVTESSHTDEKSFLESADKALYLAKNRGKNRVECEKYYCENSLIIVRN